MSAQQGGYARPLRAGEDSFDAAEREAEQNTQEHEQWQRQRQATVRLARLKAAVRRGRATRAAAGQRLSASGPETASTPAARTSGLAKALSSMGQAGHPGLVKQSGQSPDETPWAYSCLSQAKPLMTPRHAYLDQLCTLVNQGALPASALLPSDWAEIEADPVTGQLTVTRERI